ncbi:MAG: DUF167 domain-containing protein [Puniceicoccales bacterium]|jgi:uncharacterized protein (TIGR00251 family)|nr:DUF167 domain-containing protein [Puniceicoccales bacterium]
MPDACELKIKAVPNAPRSAVVGRLGDAWKIRLHAVPEDGKANKELLSFLAEKLGVPRCALELVSGGTSREKRVRIADLSAADADARLGGA